MKRILLFVILMSVAAFSANKQSINQDENAMLCAARSNLPELGQAVAMAQLAGHRIACDSDRIQFFTNMELEEVLAESQVSAALKASYRAKIAFVLGGKYPVRINTDKVREFLKLFDLDGADKKERVKQRLRSVALVAGVLIHEDWHALSHQSEAEAVELEYQVRKELVRLGFLSKSDASPTPLDRAILATLAKQ